jgi:CDP-glycerol glycerophosphotransferase (TagB/SpsB family)
MTTPGLDVYQLKRSRGVGHYAHVLHAPSDATMYRLFGLDYFDSVLLTGDYQGADIRALETQRGLPPKELVTVGCTYLDGAAQKLRVPEPQGHGRTVLVSPSWGPSGLLARFGAALLDPLAATGWTVVVRPHPQSLTSEAAVIEALMARYRDRPNVEWDTKADNVDALARSDVMISDFSGIIYDYAFLRDRPVLYVSQGLDLRPYDADDLGGPGEDRIARLWQFRTLRKIGIELREDMFPRIAEVIAAAADSPSLAAARAEARKEAWQHPGEAGGRIVDFMVAHGNVSETK